MAKQKIDQAAVDYYKEQLRTDPVWVKCAILALYDLQTEDEKAGEHTGEVNGVGFSRYDSDILMSFAQQLRAGYQLSERQLVIAFDKMPRYAAQLVRERLLEDLAVAA